MKVIVWVVMLAFLIACIEIVEEPREVVYKSEVIKADKPVENITINKSAVNISFSNATDIPNSTESTPLPTTEAWVEFEELSIAAQHKMIPALEEAVKNSSCYLVTWENLTEHASQNNLEIKKELRFEYLGARLFKGWILSKLMYHTQLLASETFTVLVDNLVVACLDERESFSIDWNKVLSRKR